MSPSPTSAEPKPPLARRLAWLRLGALAATVALAFVVVLVAVGHDRDEVRAFVDGLGPWAEVGFVALMAVLTCAFFPFPAMAAISGLLFGTAGGTILSVLGGSLGAVLAFAIARRFGAEPVAALARGRARRLLATIGERGFSAVLLLRTFPGVPRDLVNYLCGLTPVRLRAYTAATVLGIAPRAYAYTALGGSLGDLGSTQSLVAVGVLAAMAVLGIVLLRRSGSATSTSSPDDRSAGRP